MSLGHLKICETFASHTSTVSMLSPKTIVELPEDVILLLFSYLPFRDLIKCRRVCSYFLKLINGNKKLWAKARLHLIWPNQYNRNHLLLAAQAGNFEAQIKLATAYLYDEVQTVPSGDSPEIRGELSSELFEMADKQVPHMPPISWIFYRPPWRQSAVDMCCKSIVFHKLFDMARALKGSSRAIYLVGRILMYMPEETSMVEVKELLRKAVDTNSCSYSSLLLMQLENVHLKRCWETPRKLRAILAKDPFYYDAQIFLCDEYLKGMYGGVTEEIAKGFVQNMFRRSKAGIRRPHRLCRYSRERIVVISWMMEVVEAEQFSDDVLHLAVNIFDRFLERQTIDSSDFQLLGITAIVLSTRLLSLRTLTITQAVWLTDNAYRYIDVVKAMGHVVATLNGCHDTRTAAKYVAFLVQKSGCDHTLSSMVYYLVERSHFILLLRRLPQALLAASCYILASIILKRECWPVCLQEWTGFTVQMMSAMTKYLYWCRLGTFYYMYYAGWDIPHIKYSQEKFDCVAVKHYRVVYYEEIEEYFPRFPERIPTAATKTKVEAVVKGMFRRSFLTAPKSKKKKRKNEVGSG